jgi:isopentenyl-diphosphate delta-isomerase
MESVVLLDGSGRAVGTADKATVHHSRTPLHLAFSCYVFDRAGRFLLTQRALGKRTWPGIWTNTCCGHPLPAESFQDAIPRRLSAELGITATSLDLILPTFRYTAVMADGVTENEMCPVFRATTDSMPAPSPDEVEDFRWVDWAAFVSSVDAGTQPISPWCAEQLAELRPLGADPLDWPAGSAADLPPAARR